jgi:tetratricopeptide (TPR) repeat protein
LCASYLRDLKRAVAEVRQVVNMLPNRTLFRVNLALYSDYAGDFATGEQEARAVLEQGPDPYGMLALALAQIGQDQFAAAAATYEQLASAGALGASLSASGLGDLATRQGRYADAVRILEQGAVRDLAAKSADRAAAKLAAVAHAEVLRGRPREAAAAATRALASGRAVKIRFLAARSYIQAGQTADARPLVDGLAAELQAEPQAYAKIAEAEMALAARDARRAITLATEANALLDTWIGRVVLGHAYLDAGAFAQADSEFDRAIQRRGEALALFLDEEPTSAYLPQVYAYQARVREALRK